MRSSILILSSLGLLACGTPPPVSVDAAVAESDAPSAACAPAPPPGAVMGSRVGESFPGFTLPECNGAPYTFYDNEFCEEEHTFTVVSVAALWCIPCQHESAELTEAITERYRDRGVRVLQILVDGETPGRAIVPAQCERWVSTYGLVNTELMDVGGRVTNVYFPDGALPATLIVDERGVIRFRENGAAMGLESLSSALDSLLANP